MTTANKVTIARIILVPFFAVQLLYYFRTGDEMYRHIAIAAFLIATISDGVDGWLARHRNQGTQLGAYLDPIADKLLLVTGLVLLSYQFEDNRFDQRIPLWLTGTVLGRDMIVVTGSALVYLAVGDLKVRPHFLSKVSSVLQMSCIGWVLFKLPGGVTFWLAVGASVTTAITGLMYVMDGIRQFSEHPMAHPDHEEEN